MRRMLFFVLIGYLSGSVLYAQVWGRVFCGDDAAVRRDSPDHNPGTANAFAVGGVWCGILTLCCDIAKGLVPVWLYLRGRAPADVGLWLAPVLAAPVAGHVFSAFSRLHGGKGVAVTFGCLGGLLPCVWPLAAFAAAFLFFSLAVRISPHFYRTLAAYGCTLAALPLLRAPAGVCLGFVLICAAVGWRFAHSGERRAALRVNLLWMR